jgi:hypothetical protein
MLCLMPLDQIYSYGTGSVILLIILISILRRGFDPFAPIWLFLISFAQVYVVQAISYRDWAIEARGAELVAEANLRSLWALALFLAVYYSRLPRWLASKLPSAPRSWSAGTVGLLSPFLVVWGILCAGITLNTTEMSGEENLLRQFPLVMLVAAVLLIVTGRQTRAPRPLWTMMGLLVAAAYCLIWMWNAKRSHSAFAVLAAGCAFYLPRFKRPRVPTLAALGFSCILVVSIAIGWRGTTRYEQSPNGFLHYLSEFRVENLLVNLNVKERHEVDPESPEQLSKETEEYGAFLLMMATVPEKSPHDFGQSYLRLVTTYIPRMFWHDKPLPGRKEWVSAWIAGSQFRRNEDFTGPAIGVLGAAQLNGGSVATAILMISIAFGMRLGYDYFRYHADSPWAQAWWSLTYYNAWLIPLNDDPFVWFYYIYGHTTLPLCMALWVWNRMQEPRPQVGAHPAATAERSPVYA